jgi:hypothetical protein
MKNESLFRLLANLTDLLHIVVIVALLGGGFISGISLMDNAEVKPALLRLQTALVAATAVSQILFLGCPLIL